MIREDCDPDIARAVTEAVQDLADEALIQIFYGPDFQVEVAFVACLVGGFDMDVDEVVVFRALRHASALPS